MTDKNIKNQSTLLQNIWKGVKLAGILYIFLVSLELMGGSFKLLGKDFANSLVESATNPFIGLFIGMLATAIIQSSSTTTSMVVTLVAGASVNGAAAPELIASAVPIIMGANIGTSVTSTIVSLGHISKRKEYRKAIAAATIHDFFNIITVSVLFPLEVFFGVLSKPASWLASVFLVGGGDGGFLSAMKFVKHSVKPAAKGVTAGLEFIFPESVNVVAILGLIIALAVLFLSLRGLTASLKELLIGKIKDKIENVVFGNPLKGILWGTGLTTLVQSSSVTTSLTVPLVATGKVSLRRAFPFLMGANIGTTTTALIAALVSSTEAGLAIAFCHLMFNLVGVLIIFPIPFIRNIPVQLARRLGRATLKNRLVGIGYILVTFFLLPFFLIVLSGNLQSDSTSADSTNGSNPDNIEVVSTGEPTDLETPPVNN